MNPMSHRPEGTGYFEDATVSMEPSSDGQMQTQDWLLRDDRPWTGLHDATLDAQPQALSDYPLDRSAHDPFMDYRSTGMQSECETIPGDSGYGSCVPPSIENTSVYGDDHFHTQDVEQDLSSFHLNLQEPLPIDSPSCGSQKPQGLPTRAIQSSDASIYCKGCGNWLRTRAELNKHEHRHKKPFTCPYSDCKRHFNGFASQNDVLRHQMSVHKEHYLGKTYVCHHQGCAAKDTKQWPRADNFRSHLDRVHKIKKGADDDLSDYLSQSRPSHPIAEDLSGVGADLQDPLRSPDGQDMITGRQVVLSEFLDIPTPDTPVLRLPSGVQEFDDKLLMPPPPYKNESRFSLPTGLRQGSHDTHCQLDEGISASRHCAGTSGRGEDATASPESPQPATTGSRAPGTGYRQSTKCQGVPDMESESNSSTHEDSTGDGKVVQKVVLRQGAFNYGNPVGSSLSSNINQPEIMAILRTVPKHLIEEYLAGATEDTDHADHKSTPGSQMQQSCAACYKTFTRACDLRKHQKRHERPYGCTADGCDKRFGSKNDWKRHENGQHNQNDAWYCNKECAQFSNRREGFETHLRNFHRMIDEGAIQERLASNRLGSHCSGSFWCGFCRDLIATSDDDNRTVERFNHIDNHFMGRQGFPKQSIEDWRHFKPPADQPPRKGETGRKRKLTREATGRPAKQPHT